MPRLPWRTLVLWAVLATALGVTAVLVDLQRSQDHLGTLVDTAPGAEPSAVVGAELGDQAVRLGGQHDGAFYYVIARRPFSLGEAAAGLDAPRYRLQRIGFPLLAWALHPFGGGEGLMWTMFAIGVASLFGGAVAMGALSVSWRGPPWIGAVFPLLFGSIISLRISVADPMALALALASLAVWVRHEPDESDERRAWWLALSVVLAVAATLTKEPTLLVFVGYWCAVRTRRAAALVVVPAVVAGAWAAVLWWKVPAGTHIEAFVPPFTALPDAITQWGARDEPLAYLSIALGLLLGVYALAKRGLRHPLSYVVILQLALLSVVSLSVLVPERSATRQVMPLITAAALMLLTPSAGSRDLSGTSAARAAGTRKNRGAGSHRGADSVA